MPDFSLSRIDKALIGISFAGMLACAFLLIQDQYLRDMFISVRQSASPIGLVDHATRDVRRRGQESLLWTPVYSEQTLFERDTIFTGDQSATELFMDDGTRITVGANSLVVLTRQGDDLLLDLQLGRAWAQLGSKKSIGIKQNKTVARVSNVKESSIVQMGKTEDGKLNLGNIEGELTVEVNNQVNRLPANHKLEISPNEQVQVKKNPIRWIHPKLGQELWVNRKQKLAFRWQDGPKQARFILARDQKFDHPVADRRVSGTQVEVSSNWKPGTYNWKVFDGNSGGLLFEGAVFLQDQSPPKPFFPHDGYETELGQSEQSARLRFAWQNKRAVEGYKIEISKDENFSRPIKHETSAHLIDGVKLGPGWYWWRVSANDQSPIAGTWSKPVSFRIRSYGENSSISVPMVAVPEATIPVDPPAPSVPKVSEKAVAKANAPVEWKPPVLRSPKQKVTLKFQKNAVGRSPSAAQKSILNPPVLQWSKDGGKKMKLEISKDPAFTDITTSATISGSSFKWKQALPGQYYWRLKSREAPTRASKVGRLQVSLPSPFLKPVKLEEKTLDPKNLSLPKSDLPITWSPVPMAEKYSLQVARDRRFKMPVGSEVVTSAEAKLKLPSPGSYFVRVAAMYGGRAVSSFSKPQKVEFQRHLDLAIPRLRSPSDGVEILTFGEESSSNPTVIMSWKKVQHAADYELEVADGPDFKNKVFTTSIRDNQYLLEKRLPQGQFYWRVRARRKSDSSDWSNASKFSLVKQE